MSVQIAQRLRVPGGDGTERQDVWSMVNAAAAKTSKQPVANLGQGFYGFNPPEFVLQAARQSFERVEFNQYAPTKGLPRLKKALADAYSPFFDKKLDPDTEIVVTSGANEGLGCAMLAFLNPGDEVLMFEPYFDQYLRYIQLCGAVLKHIPLTPPADSDSRTISSAEWTFEKSALEAAITPKTRAIILNSPHNPIGKILSREELLTIGNLCVKHNILIFSDEVYERLYYTPFTRIGTLTPEIANLTLTIGSVGKTFYATGWRLGYLIGPAHLISPVAQAHMWICYASPTPLQQAAATAYEQAEENNFWDDCKKDMKARQDYLNEIWDELGLPYTNPEGGYFVLVNTKKIRVPEDFQYPPEIADLSRDFKVAWFLILEFGVVSIPTTDFYSSQGGHRAGDYLRFSACKPFDVFDLAKQRLRGLKQYIEV